MNSRGDEEESDAMLYCDTAKLDASRAFTSLCRCPHCGDLMIAPFASEFVAHGEIRHHWECEACGRPFSSTVPLCRNNE